MKTFLFLCFFSLSAFATTWDDLSEGKTYHLTQNFQLKQTERSGSLFDFTKGDKVTLKEITALDTINVMLYTLTLKTCPGPDLKTEIEIIPVESTRVEFGAQLENCQLQVFLETKDIWSPSIFE